MATLAPGWLIEYTYSTPGISRSFFSMGTLTRSSTSLTLAPGISTKTSAKGTTICGSSSRGVASTAKNPRSSEAKMTSWVSLESMKACATRPANPSRSVTTAPRCGRHRSRGRRPR